MTDSITENEITKSSARQDPNASKWDNEYSEGDQCKMVVREVCIDGNTRTSNKTFIVRAVQKPQAKYEYQLEEKRNPLTGQLYDGGKWFPESKLKSA